MTRLFTTIIILLLGLNSQAQNNGGLDSLNQEVSPIGGINTLATKYYGTEFTKEQRLLLKNKEIEFIFQVDELGIPTLSEINGTTNTAIIDSLKARTKYINNFNPRIRNGIPEPSIYFMQLTFPTYSIFKNQIGILQGTVYSEAEIKDFEYIKFSNIRVDMVIGGVMNQFIGEPFNYLKTGGGMHLDVSVTGRKNYIYGLGMNAYGNGSKKDYPLSTSKEQFSSPSTFLIGAIFGKWFNKFSIQSEFHLAVQNVVEKLSDNDPEWIQLDGWSPGVLINYPIRLGKQRPMYYYGTPSILENNINLHFGLRYLFLSIPEASGIMAEVGVSYRMGLRYVKEYKLNDEFYSR